MDIFEVAPFFFMALGPNSIARFATRWLVCLTAAAGLTGCVRPPEPTAMDFLPSRKLTVLVSNHYLAEIAREIGQEHVEVRCLLDPISSTKSSGRKIKPATETAGGEPATENLEKPWPPDVRRFVFSAGDILAMKLADAVVLHGFGLDAALEAEMKAVRENKVSIACVSDYIPADALIYLPGEPPRVDPQIWTSPKLFLYAVEATRDAIVGAFPPETVTIFDSKAEELKDKCRRLDEWARKTLEVCGRPEGQRFLLTSHASLNYFAREYGIEARALFTSDGERIPAAEEELKAWLEHNSVKSFTPEGFLPHEEIAAACAQFQVVATSPVYSLYLARPGTRSLGLVHTHDVSTWEGAFRGLVHAIHRDLGARPQAEEPRANPNQATPAPGETGDAPVEALSSDSASKP